MAPSTYSYLYLPIVQKKRNKLFLEILLFPSVFASKLDISGGSSLMSCQFFSV
jgi:hypothetical protein